jgi:hypothetical protein
MKVHTLTPNRCLSDLLLVTHPRPRPQGFLFGCNIRAISSFLVCTTLCGKKKQWCGSAGPLMACHFSITYVLPMSTRGMSHGGLAIYIKKYLKAKEELWKFKYFTMQNKI